MKNLQLVSLLLVVLAILLAAAGCASPKPGAPEPTEAEALPEHGREYLEMDTSKGVRVLVMANLSGIYECILIPGGDAKLNLTDALGLHHLTVEETEAILKALKVEDSAVTLHPYKDVISSYAYRIDEAYCVEIGRIFGDRYAVGEKLSLSDFAEMEINE